MNKDKIEKGGKALERHHSSLIEWLKQISSISSALIGFVAVYMRADAYPGISWIPSAGIALLVSGLLTILAAMVALRGIWKSHLNLANKILLSANDPEQSQKTFSSRLNKIEQSCITAAFVLFVVSVCGLTFSLISLISIPRMSMIQAQHPDPQECAKGLEPSFVPFRAPSHE